LSCYSSYLRTKICTLYLINQPQSGLNRNQEPLNTGEKDNTICYRIPQRTGEMPEDFTYISSGNPNTPAHWGNAGGFHVHLGR